jgi:uncharacterized membrane protein
MTRWLDVLQRYTGKSAFIAFFILCALPTGLMMALLTLPGYPPDERHHLARAEGLLRGEILAERQAYTDPVTHLPSWEAGLKVDTGLFQASGTQGPGIANSQVLTAAQFLAMRTQPPDHSLTWENVANTTQYFPVAYVPATLALALGKAVNAPPYICFYLARLFMLAAFLTLGVLTLWLTEYGEAALLTVLILPSTLLLAGAVNQDGILIGLACLACAALTRGTPGFRRLSLILVALFLVSKAAYIPLLGVFLLPCCGLNFWRRVRDAAIACIPVLVWVVLVALFVIVPTGHIIYHPGPLYAGDSSQLLDQTNPAANLHILLAQPLRLLTLPWSSTLAQGTSILRGAIGIQYSFERIFPSLYCQLWWACIVVAFAGLAFSPRPGAARGNALFVSFLLLATYWLILLVAYVDWTEVGMDFIWGMQGRYLLPLLPFLLFVIPQLRGRFKVHPFVPAIPSILMGLAGLGYLPMKLVFNYYLH